MSEIDPAQMDPAELQAKIDEGVQMSPEEMAVATRLGLFAGARVSGAVTMGEDFGELPDETRGFDLYYVTLADAEGKFKTVSVQAATSQDAGDFALQEAGANADPFNRLVGVTTAPPPEAAPSQVVLDESVQEDTPVSSGFVKHDVLVAWIEEMLSPKLAALTSRLDAVEAQLRDLNPSEIARPARELMASVDERFNELGAKIAGLEQLGDLSEQKAEIEQHLEILRPLSKAEVHGPT